MYPHDASLTRLLLDYQIVTEMVIPFAEAEEIYQAEKTLFGPLKWVSPSSSGRNQTCMECRVQVAAALPRGVFFRAIAYPRFLKTFTFQLDCNRVETRVHVTLYRLEVNPLRAHTNKPFGPENIRSLFFQAGQSHEHDFHDNLTEDGELRSESCFQARPLSVPPSDFATALAMVCGRINIVNGSDVPNPPLQGALF